jgi:hypothetical protein
MNVQNTNNTLKEVSLLSDWELALDWLSELLADDVD